MTQLQRPVGRHPRRARRAAALLLLVGGMAAVPGPGPRAGWESDDDLPASVRGRSEAEILEYVNRENERSGEERWQAAVTRHERRLQDQRNFREANEALVKVRLGEEREAELRREAAREAEERTGRLQQVLVLLAVAGVGALAYMWRRPVAVGPAAPVAMRPAEAAVPAGAAPQAAKPAAPAPAPASGSPGAVPSLSAAARRAAAAESRHLSATPSFGAEGPPRPVTRPAGPPPRRTP